MDIIEKIEELRELIYDKFDRPPSEIEKESDKDFIYQWHRLTVNEAEYISKMVDDRIIDLKRDQDNNIDEIYFLYRIDEAFNNKEIC